MTSTPTMTETSPIPDLTVNDRCDRCGVDSFGRGISQAFVRVRLSSGHLLDFCGNHARRNMPALVAQGAEVLDCTDRINEKASQSSN